jgi:hypothetical protein
MRELSIGTLADMAFQLPAKLLWLRSSWVFERLDSTNCVAQEVTAAAVPVEARDTPCLTPHRTSGSTVQSPESHAHTRARSLTPCSTQSAGHPPVEDRASTQ